MEADLITRLKASAPVAAIAGTRIGWLALPRGTTGARLLIFMISPGREYDHDGPDGLDGPTVQIDALASTPDTALALADAVRAEIEGWPATGGETGGTRFYSAQQVGGGFTDEGEEAGGATLFRVSRDYQFFHEEI